ncbi:DUF6069 family protein [Haloarchaeobius sp. DFWS5]|uniref:DUF6069 family protein n=1 Tax=Haloarchaeobius sp. DFWS5 TaxID=3446114 RepID=UPI003EBDD059
MGTTTVGAPAKSFQPLRVVVERGATAAGIAVIVNTILLVVGDRFVDIPAGFDPLEIGSVVVASAVGALAATAVYIVLDRVVDDPDRVFTAVAAVVLALSLLPVFFVAPTMAAGVGAGVIALLALMHVAVAVSSVGVLTHGEIFDRAQP